jgi:hypothetical protein
LLSVSSSSTSSSGGWNGRNEGRATRSGRLGASIVEGGDLPRPSDPGLPDGVLAMRARTEVDASI